MYDKNGILYCEKPKCHSLCPVDISANCVSAFSELKNDINKNFCECLPGWEGDYCKTKKFLNLE